MQDLSAFLAFLHTAETANYLFGPYSSPQKVSTN